MKTSRLLILSLSAFVFSHVLMVAVHAQISQHCSLAGRWGNGPCSAVEARDGKVYFTNGGYFEIVDFSNADHPVPVSKTWIGEDMRGMAMNGNLAFLANGYNGLAIVDVFNPDEPLIIKKLPLNYSDYAYDVVVNDSIAYLAGLDYLHVIDIRNPTVSSEINTFESGSFGWEISMTDTLVCLSIANTGLRIIDISDPKNLVEICHFDPAYSVYGAEIKDGYLYLADFNDGLRVLDITNLSSPVEVAHLDAGGRFYNITIHDNFIFASDIDSGMHIIDISTPTAPALVGTLKGSGTVRVFVSNDKAYVAFGSNGLSIVDIGTISNPVERVRYETGGQAEGIDIAGDYAYIAELNNGLRILDITDPENISKAGFLQLNAKVKNIDVNGNYAYLACYDDGLYIVDITDPSEPVLTGVFPVHHPTTDVYVHQDKAYINIINQGMKIVDVSVPSSPVESGYIEIGGYPHSVSIINDIAFVAANDSGLRIIDVSNASLPVEIGYFNKGNYLVDSDIDGFYAYVAYNDSGMSILNIEAPKNPVEISSLAIDYPLWGVRKLGDYAYLYGYEGGLQIADVSDPANPQKAGWYFEGIYIYDIEVQDNLVYMVHSRNGLSVVRNDLISGIYKPSAFTDEPALQCYPNPFTGSANIEFRLESTSNVSISICTIDGRLVKILLDNKTILPGSHTLTWQGDAFDASYIPAGVYLCVINTTQASETIKLIKSGRP